MGKPLIDIIVTHYNEPWHLGRPFFQMLSNQRSVDFNDITVTLVQDGEENALPWDELLNEFSFKTRVITIPHGGISAARNEGMRSTSSDWIMFCNFDDMFSDVCTLRMMLDNLPTDECDVIWAPYLQESKWFTGHVYINMIDEANFVKTDNKLYRRKFLKDHNIQFINDVSVFSGYIFNALVLTDAKPWRVAKLTTDFRTYFKTFRLDSMTHSLEGFNAVRKERFNMNKILVDLYLKRKNKQAYKKAVAKTVADVYYSIHVPDHGEEKNSITPEFIDFFRIHRDTFHEVPSTDLDVIKDTAETEAMNIIQHFYNEHKMECYFVNDDIFFDDWLAIVEQYAQEETSAPVTKTKPEALPAPKSVVIDNEPRTVTMKQPDHATEQPSAIIKPQHTEFSVQDPRVVVYCGTYHTYMNMIASAKSLLCNVKVDKIYFLIEDDEFPYEIPDIIETINVKDQKYFTPDGPNFNNSWTYMCMMRAAFPEMFPQYDKILSLDIDIVIRDDVSDLWDYDLTDYYLAGVEEPQRRDKTSDPLYINFGVVMMNLKKLREDHKGPEIIKSLNTQKHGCPEQDAFNKFCAGHILKIPNDFNVTVYSHITGEPQKERILHYAGQKFWRHYANVKGYGDLNWDAIMQKQNELQR